MLIYRNASSNKYTQSRQRYTGKQNSQVDFYRDNNEFKHNVK